MSAENETQLQLFQQHRAALFARAYRLLGNAFDADDIVQEAFLRWQRTPPNRAVSPKAFLMTMVTNLCIDMLRSSRVRRDTCTTAWHEQLGARDGSTDPGQKIERDEAITSAFLRILERLTPRERAALILHDVFAYNFHEVSAVTGTHPTHTRQIAHRARERVSDHRPRFSASPLQAERAADVFTRAATAGRLADLVAFFAHDIACSNDETGGHACGRT
jgi:RNA polymerase sigma-70 factor (ECF subfamily)